MNRFNHISVRLLNRIFYPFILKKVKVNSNNIIIISHSIINKYYQYSTSSSRLNHSTHNKSESIKVISPSLNPNIVTNSIHVTTSSSNPSTTVKTSFLSPESCIADKTFTNRWAMIIPAVCTHICLGSPFAWSIMVDAITKDHGFVTAAASDWTLSQAAFPMSIVLGMYLYNIYAYML